MINAMPYSTAPRIAAMIPAITSTTAMSHKMNSMRRSVPRRTCRETRVHPFGDLAFEVLARAFASTRQRVAAVVEVVPVVPGVVGVTVSRSAATCLRSWFTSSRSCATSACTSLSSGST